jgi:glycosyltransferase involved in cell wall biosynthesis
MPPPQPVTPHRPLRLLCLAATLDWSLGDVRIDNPLTAWAAACDGAFRLRAIADFSPEDVAWADFVLLQRESNAYVVRLIAHLQRAGKIVLFDIDDLLTEVPPFLAVYRHCLRMRGDLIKALSMADGVTVSTPRLAEEMARYNRRVHLVPNCSATAHGRVRHDDGAPVTLVVASSDTVRVDFVVPALKRIMARADFRGRLLGIGPPGDYLRQAGLEVECLPTMRYAPFQALLAGLDNAIGIIPLDRSRFSACKSAIKFVDYSLAGIPSVCSDVPPYSDVARDGATALLAANDEAAWVAAIARLTGDAATRRRLADAAHSLCREDRSLARAAQAWQGVLAAYTLPAPAADGRLLVLPRIGWGVRLRGLAARALSARSYQAAYRVFRREGLGGVTRRLGRIF